MEADFSGYATKSGVKCTDGRTIASEAFKHQDKMQVPLVWQHRHDAIENVLGHMILENRKDGVYAYGYFNDTENGQMAKMMVKHGDLDSLSIFARRLQQQGSLVQHGDITEVSLCLNGANSEARIDNINLMHGDDIVGESETEAIIYPGEELQHENPEGETVGDKATTGVDDEQELELQHAAATAEKEQTLGDVLATLTDDQETAMYAVVAEAVNVAKKEAAGETMAAHSVSFSDDEAFIAHIDQKIEEGFTDMRNVFEKGSEKTLDHSDRPRLTRQQLKEIMLDETRGSLKESFIAHAADYGIDDINLLFPNAQLDSNGITYVSRRMEWVASVLGSVHKSPFARIKSLSADITADEARAKGYVKGSLKRDEIVKMLKRETTPQTVYKKQKLDRDDIVDITDVDVLTWIQTEMRIMLDEEIAAAILFGDNRDIDSDDKIDEDKVRPIAYDVELYNTVVPLLSNIAVSDLIDAVVTGLIDYKGSGSPVFYTTRPIFTKMILAKDGLGRRLYATKAELAAALTVDDVITCEAMQRNSDLFGIVVDLSDYTVGADKGGEINLFDFFDIDYNQQKYLLETRISGALTKPKAAVTFTVDASDIVTPPAPTFVNSTGVLTIPSHAGVSYIDPGTGTAYTAGAQTAISVGDTIDIEAVPLTGYGFAHDADTTWSFTRVA